MSDELRVLAEEQAALRRVATLVARGVAPDEVFAAVTREVGQLLALGTAFLGRYEPRGEVTAVASWGAAEDIVAVGSRWVLGGKNLVTMVFETGRAARIDGYADASGPIGAAGRETGFHSAVGAPVIVEDRLWGVIAAGSTVEEKLPEDTEARMASFTDLVATAIANAESRAGLARLVQEQAALRRVATLVARGAAPERVFAAVAQEVGELLAVDFAYMGRYEPEGAVTIIAAWPAAVPTAPVGSRFMLGGRNLGTIVFNTGRTTRRDSVADASGPAGVAARESGVRSAVGTPIVVEGHRWGIMAVGSSIERGLPADTEARLVQFTELVATAIANTESRAALAASRARIVAATDETRRQIERDLHDGTQQQLVSLLLDLRAAQAAAPADVSELNAQLARTERAVGAVLDDLRELSRGIHPAILSKGGLEPAVRAVARRSALPVELDLHAEGRLPEPVEVAAYYVVSEALANVAKHARASVVNVELEASDAEVQLAIRDDGVGGADPGHGSGLVGLSDRVEALGGSLQLASPAGSGTTLLIQIPVEGRASARTPGPSRSSLPSSGPDVR